MDLQVKTRFKDIKNNKLGFEEIAQSNVESKGFIACTLGDSSYSMGATAEDGEILILVEYGSTLEGFKGDSNNQNEAELIFKTGVEFVLMYSITDTETIHALNDSFEIILDDNLQFRENARALAISHAERTLRSVLANTSFYYVPVSISRQAPT